MSKPRHRDQLIQEELHAHIADTVDDLVSEGMSTEEAQHIAQQQFGDIQGIKKQVASQYSNSVWERFGPLVCIGGPYVTLSLSFLILWLFLQKTMIGATLAPLFLWWVYIGIIAFVLMLVYWIIEYAGLSSTRSAFISIFFVLLAALSLTSILDINDFEVNIHAVFLGVLLYVLGRFVWPHVSAFIKRSVLYLFTVAVLWSTLVQEPLFAFVGTARCLYIRSSEGALPEVLAICSQVPFMSRLLIPLYLLIIVGLPYFIYFLMRYWSNSSTMLYRKIIMSAAIVALPVTPFIFHDVNTLGGLDVIPWKADIYEVYWEVLGRRPEDKDIQFYARTRAYENLDQVKEVLYQSKERRLKIRLLYQEFLGRKPSKEEVQFYTENKRSIDGIIEDLQVMSNQIE